MSKIAAKIHQGRYDTESELLTLRKNAIAKNSMEVEDAVNQRLKRLFPKIYRRLVGPLTQRNRDKRFHCYCNHPASYENVLLDIMADEVPIDALTCDDCWADDLSGTWGYFGWARKIIPVSKWQSLCDARADMKFVG